MGADGASGSLTGATEDDGAGRSTGWDEVTFDRLLRELVEDTAPRLFALAEERGERDDGRVFAWGVEFEDRAALLTHSGRALGTFGPAVSAHRRFSELATMRLVWADPRLRPDESGQHRSPPGAR